MDNLIQKLPLILYILPLVSTVIIVNNYEFIQSGERPSSNTGVLSEVQIGNRTTARIGCGLECNRVLECIGFDVIKMDITVCRILSGFVSLIPSLNPENQTFRYQKSHPEDCRCLDTLCVCNKYGPISVYRVTDTRYLNLIQRRLDGSVDFIRPWNDYKAGFGSPDSEFWIGNANIHALTSDGYTFLRIELMDHNGVWKYAEYSSFYIEDQNNNYKMHVSSYTGNAGDSFSYHDNMNFTTYDNDNDESTLFNCAQLRKGGWWYNNCHKSNLNGEYANNRDSDGINWFAWMGFNYSLPEVRMMLRRP